VLLPSEQSLFNGAHLSTWIDLLSRAGEGRGREGHGEIIHQWIGVSTEQGKAYNSNCLPNKMSEK